MSESITAVNEAEIKAALNARRGDWETIRAKARVSHSWISKFVRNEIPNPGIDTLRKVQTALNELGA